MTLVGDCERTDPKLYKEHCNLFIAQVIANILCQKLQWEYIEIRRGYTTDRNLYGTCNAMVEKPYINLYRLNVGTLLHEMAHICEKHHQKTLNHNNIFRKYHRKLLKIWREEMAGKFL